MTIHIIRDNRSYWYNYQTEQHEYIETPTDFTAYIPQILAAQELYSLYLEMGIEVREAAAKVLKACVGEPTS